MNVNYIDSTPTGTNSTVGDVIGKKIIPQTVHTLLAGTLQNAVVMQGQETSAVPANLQHQFTYRLYTSPMEQAMGLAAQAGQKIYTITAQVYQDNPNIVNNQLFAHSQSTKDRIQQALDAGYEITIHEAPITQDGWTGAGYFMIDPNTGSGGYLIEGGANGAILILIGFFLVLMTLAMLPATIYMLPAIVAAKSAEIGIVFLLGATSLTMGLGIEGYIDKVYCKLAFGIFLSTVLAFFFGLILTSISIMTALAKTILGNLFIVLIRGWPTRVIPTGIGFFNSDDLCSP